MIARTNVIYFRLCPYIHNIYTNAGAVICGTQCTLRRTCICQRCRTAANMLNLNRIDFHLCGAALRQTAGRGRCSLRSKRKCINIGRKNHSFNGFRTVHHGNIYRIAAVAGNCCFRCFCNIVLVCNYSRIICGRNPLLIPACLNARKALYGALSCAFRSADAVRDAKDNTATADAATAAMIFFINFIVSSSLFTHCHAMRFTFFQYYSTFQKSCLCTF